MQRFILRQNVENFRRLLDEKTDEESQRTLRSLLLAAQRDLAFLESATDGVGTALLPPGYGRGGFHPDPRSVSEFQANYGSSAKLCLAIDPGPGLHIVDVNDAYLQATMSTRAALLGKPLFEAFPDNPDDPNANGVSLLYASLRMAGETRKPDAMRICRYDIRAPSGRFVLRYWSPLNTPVFDEEGRLIYLLHQVEDVTDDVLASSASLN